jgi:endo-1,4-beta-xylanase
MNSPRTRTGSGRRAGRRAAAAWLGCLVLAACGAGDAAGPPSDTDTTTPPAQEPLRTLAARWGVSIGAATGSAFQRTDATGTTLRAILARDYSMVWSGNFLKFNTLRPTQDTYGFQWADSMVAFAQANSLAVRGHVFVWHNRQQLPGWLTAPAAWTSAQVDSILRDHITTVMHRYRGRIRIWDVVNEALDDNAVTRTSESFWYVQLGPDYIERAFRLARAADSTALLFYNDYNIEGLNAKSDATYALLGDLRGRGVPVDGIGMQCHFQVGRLPSSQDLVVNFDRFARLGLKIQITELDIRMPVPATTQNLAQQAVDYRTIVNACLQTSACDAIVLAGVYDGDSWVPSTFPGEGAALLLDELFYPKPAYTAVYNFLAGR